MSGTAPQAGRRAKGDPGEQLVAGARVVLVDDEPELDLHEGQAATLTRVDLADREVGFVLDDGREFTADASSVTPAPTDAGRAGEGSAANAASAGRTAGAADAPALW